MRPLLPPRYVNCPVDLIFDLDIPAGIKETFLQLRGLAWDSNETPRMLWSDLTRITGKPQSTLYNHLADLRNRGWLLFSSAGKSFVIVVFRENGNLSQNLELVNEEVNLTDINLTRIVKHHPDNQDLKTAKTLSKTRIFTKNEKVISDNGWHGVIDPELEVLLRDVGVFPEKFKSVADSGWTPGQIRQLARQILEEKGPGKGGGILCHRLENFAPPVTDVERRAAYVKDLERYGVER